MDVRVALQEFASMLKVASGAMHDLASRADCGGARDEVIELLGQTNEIADRLSTVSDQINRVPDQH